MPEKFEEPKEEKPEGKPEKKENLYFKPIFEERLDKEERIKAVKQRLLKIAQTPYERYKEEPKSDINLAGIVSWRIKWAIREDKDEEEEFKSELTKTIERIKPSTSGKPIVDLGYGGSWIFMLDIAKILKASEYVGVDKYYDFPTGREETDEEIKIKLVSEDMLKYLKELPPRYGNFIINGIEPQVIPDDSYLAKVLLELDEKIADEGIVISIRSPFLRNLEDIGYDIEYGEYGGEPIGITIYKKAPLAKE